MYIPSESRDQTDLTLVHGFEWVGAAEATGNGAAEADAFSESVDWRMDVIG